MSGNEWQAQHGWIRAGIGTALVVVAVAVSYADLVNVPDGARGVLIAFAWMALLPGVIAFALSAPHFTPAIFAGVAAVIVMATGLTHALWWNDPGGDSGDGLEARFMVFVMALSLTTLGSIVIWLPAALIHGLHEARE